jgi:hypothetical protein
LRRAEKEPDGGTGEQGRRLELAWRGGDDALPSHVTIDFIPIEADVVTVRLVHAGPLREATAAEMQDRWEWAMDSLKSYLETGSPIDYDDWASRREMGY